MGDSKDVLGRKLVVLSGNSKNTSFALTEQEVRAGRAEDNAICLRGKRVSRYHAVLVRSNGEYSIRDLSPRIGTFLNGRPRRAASLKLGDRIRIGEFEMCYEVATEPVAERSPAVTPSNGEELTALRLQLAAAQQELDAAQTEAERSANKFQQRLAELTQENSRLVGEVHGANDALESLRAESHARSTQEQTALTALRLQLTAAQQELDTARTEAQRSANESQQRLAELTQQNARLVGEVRGADEALESLRAESHARSTQEQAALTERLSVLSQENAALIARLGELQARIAPLEEAAAQVSHLETELAATQAALQPMSEELAKLRKSHKLDAIAEELARALESAPADRAEQLERFQTVLAEARAEWVKVSDLQAQIEQLVLENHNLRKAMAKAQEEAVRAKCCLAGQTNEEFHQIRRAFAAKRTEKPDKLRKLWPFRAAWRPL